MKNKIELNMKRAFPLLMKDFQEEGCGKDCFFPCSLCRLKNTKECRNENKRMGYMQYNEAVMFGLIKPGVYSIDGKLIPVGQYDEYMKNR